MSLYPIDGGASTCNKVINRPDLVERYKKILDYLDWYGIADFDCIEDPRNGEILLMEINPRVPGTIKASFLAGIDIAEIMVCHSLNRPYENYSYKYGFYMRNLAAECVWFIASKQRSPVCHAACMMKRCAILAAGNYIHCLFYEDYHLWIRMIMNNSKFHNIQEVLYWVRTTEEQLMRRGGFSYLRNELKAFKEFYDWGFCSIRDLITNSVISYEIKVDDF